MPSLFQLSCPQALPVLTDADRIYDVEAFRIWTVTDTHPIWIFTHSVLQQFGYLWVLWVLRVSSFRLGWFRLISSAICLQDLDASEGFIAELFEPASQSKAIGHHWQIWEEAAICCNITCDICSVDLVKSLESRGLHDPVDPAGRGVQKTSPRHTDCW